MRLFQRRHRHQNPHVSVVLHAKPARRRQAGCLRHNLRRARPLSRPACQSPEKGPIAVRASSLHIPAIGAKPARLTCGFGRHVFVRLRRTPLGTVPNLHRPNEAPVLGKSGTVPSRPPYGELAWDSPGFPGELAWDSPGFRHRRLRVAAGVGRVGEVSNAACGEGRVPARPRTRGRASLPAECLVNSASP